MFGKDTEVGLNQISKEAGPMSMARCVQTMKMGYQEDGTRGSWAEYKWGNEEGTLINL